MQNTSNMAYPKKMIQVSDKDALVEMVHDLQDRLKKKNAELLRARKKLNAAKSTIVRMKNTVEFQRKRIIELYPVA
jgi:hypothetical protein